MRRTGLAAAAAVLTLAAPASADDFQLHRVASGLARPVFLTAPPGDTDRVFIVEQHAGQIRILRRGDLTLEADPFLTVSGVATGSEQGLLGLAFDPDYATNGTFYVYLTDPDTKVVRYQVSADPDIADETSATPVLGFVQPQNNHNGGWIAFDAAGLLYVSTGDGGASNDDGAGHTAGIGNAQDTDKLLGKILRIDPSGDDFPADPDRNYAIPSGNPFVGVSGADEIWVYGLRNPWRPSFDRATGDLYVGDVGQSNCEEIDVQPAASSGGENYGWRLREGTIATPTGGVGGAAPAGAIDPIFDYSHGGLETCSDPGPGFSGISITGGYVYRGPLVELAGRYFFADFGTAKLWSLLWDGSDPSLFDGTNYTDLTDHSGDPRFVPLTGSLGLVSSFGEDADGNLYVLDLDGDVFLLPEPGGVDALAAGILAILGLARTRRPRARPAAKPEGAARTRLASAPTRRTAGAA